jgi:hypothetical protein
VAVLVVKTIYLTMSVHIAVVALRVTVSKKEVCVSAESEHLKERAEELLTTLICGMAE